MSNADLIAYGMRNGLVSPPTPPKKKEVGGLTIKKMVNARRRWHTHQKLHSMYLVIPKEYV